MRLIKRKDDGLFSIEFALIFPIVLGVVLILVVFGFYVFQCVRVCDHAQKAAVIAARESYMPGYKTLYDINGGITVHSDFGNLNIDSSVIKTLMKEHDPYRYFGESYINYNERTSIVQFLTETIENDSVIKVASVDCDVTTENHIINQTVYVTVKMTVEVPKFFHSLGVSDWENTITAKAIVTDCAEFVRNTNIVFDVKDFLFDNLKIGGTSINERIGKFKSKFSFCKDNIVTDE